MNKLKKFLLAIFILALLAGAWFFMVNFSNYKNMVYGVSFNLEHAVYLGLDPKKSLQRILNDWHFRYIRFSAQWDLIEKERGRYDWRDLDWQMDEAAKKNAKVVLAVGNKTPRWPECHAPVWVERGSFELRKESVLAFITAVVNRYKHHPALEIWQVENEPFLRFGDCTPISRQGLKEEIDLVKGLDEKHPVMVTDSGELSLWWRTARAGDLFGTTMYRMVWNKFIGYWNYDWLIPPFIYTAKLWLNGRDINSAYVMELQAEPWIADKDLFDVPLEEQFKTMSLERLKSNVDFAARTGMSRSYLWGAEWWLWLEKQGVHDFSNYIKQLKKQ
jgi:Glycosyl hydrolase family 10